MPISRVCDVSIDTVSKMLVDGGQVCAAYHDQYVRGLECKRVQCDEIWSSRDWRERNLKFVKATQEGPGNVWTWTALDAVTKLLVTWSVGARDADNGKYCCADRRTG